ncbi:hypothetical protein GCM10010169_08970 [Micromonospora fulviviridis]|nr:hypothetical protein GCM10010169_08970 [Micromonospora fulviviridis]
MSYETSWKESAAEAGVAEAATNAPATPNPASQRRVELESMLGVPPVNDQVEPVELKEPLSRPAVPGRLHRHILTERLISVGAMFRRPVPVNRAGHREVQ